MSDYSKSYDGAAKDAAQSTITGADFDTEFSAIATASATKANKVTPAAAGNVATLSGAGDLQDSGVTSTELAILDGATVTTTEINYVSGVTSAIQTQIDNTAGRRGAVVYRTTAQSISSSSFTNINWTSELYDTDSIHDNATNNTRLTVPSGVTKVKLSASMYWATGNAGDRQIIITKNGSSSYVGVGIDLTYPSSPTDISHSVTTPVLEVTGGDYFECLVAQTSGSALDATSQYGSWFAMEIIK